jgi:hypothetical protein
MSGLYLDGWAHRNTDLEDSITTPWHGVLYSGFMAAAGWMTYLVARDRRGAELSELASPGYGLGLVGVGFFAVGGLFDQFWHIAWGVEQDLNAFFSPTHWMLAIGMALMVSCPLRAWWALSTDESPTMVQFLPCLWSACLTLGMIQFDLNYLSFWITDLPGVEPQVNEALSAVGNPEFEFFTVERLRGSAVAMIIITTLLLMGMTLNLVRRWRVPAGSFTVLFTVVAAAVNAVWEYPFGWVVAAAAVGGITADVLVNRIDPRPSDIRSWRLLAGIVPVPMWLAYYGILKLRYEIHWPGELWTGSIIMACLASLILSYLMQPTASPANTSLR